MAIPLSQNELRRVLERITAQEPFFVIASVDDLDASIGSQAPRAATAGALIERLRGHLKRLTDIAVTDPSSRPATVGGYQLMRTYLVGAAASTDPGPHSVAARATPP
ncbi:hypothetical protein [Streptomyces sp. NPDC055099]